MHCHMISENRQTIIIITIVLFIYYIDHKELRFSGSFIELARVFCFLKLLVFLH